MRRWSVVLLACASCTSDASRPPPLAALPPPAPADTERFRDAEACAQCHLVPDGATPLHDAAGHNVSPVLLWRSSMMALAARDPYYLAAFAEERTRAPDRAAEIDAVCTRCHAPAGSEELASNGQHLSFDELTAGTSEEAALGRGGITCTLCHQIGAANLGEDSSFTGGFRVGYQRQLFGRYLNPVTSWMQLIVNFTPTAGTHIAESSLCGSCHTVILPGSSGEVVEQATFLEWRSSRSATLGQPCQSCHVPTLDEAGAPLTVLAISGTPANLGARTPFGRHTFVGGNSYVLRLLADAPDWSNANVSSSELLGSAARDDAHLAGAARVELTTHDASHVAIRVTNLTGHKLPTGYPSRRVWLHVRIEAAGAVVFESGAVDDRGAIVDRGGHVLADQPHRDEITGEDQVQIWEARLIGPDGMVTHRTLDARHYDKDDRILPAGFAPTGSDRSRTLPIGPELDPSFTPGSDDVTYRPAGGVPAGARVTIELLYEAVSPGIVDAIDDAATPAGTRFVDLSRARPIAPVVMSTLAMTL
jgi:hypothetical protein